MFRFIRSRLRDLFAIEPCPSGRPTEHETAPPVSSAGDRRAVISGDGIGSPLEPIADDMTIERVAEGTIEEIIVDGDASIRIVAAQILGFEPGDRFSGLFGGCRDCGFHVLQYLNERNSGPRIYCCHCGNEQTFRVEISRFIDDQHVEHKIVEIPDVPIIHFEDCE